ncbi:MAG: hypothetical protein OXC11_11535 [Rhodospirillales bacterium]|nr:hypothetical protein [Rhodospirillales bacterium]
MPVINHSAIASIGIAHAIQTAAAIPLLKDMSFSFALLAIRSLASQPDFWAGMGRIVHEHAAPLMREGV